MSRFSHVFDRLKPRSLYARFFWLQLALVTFITAVFLVLIAMNQTRSNMDNLADVWAPALEDAMSRLAAGPQEDITISRHVTLVHGVPPADVYAPNRSHLRWWALQNALQQRGLPVKELVVSGATGEAVVWLNMGGDAAPRWIGVRSNLEGADFPARWTIAISLSLAMIALAAWWLSRKVAMPLRELESAVKAFSAGEPFVAPLRSAPTEVHALVTAFGAMATERQELEAQRALMLASISHDIRSPLARIRMAAELMQEQAEYAALVERIIRNVGIADDLIESFSDYVRAESAAMDQKLDLIALVHEVARLTDTPIASALPLETVWVNGNANLLQRALDNLIDNAEKHGRPPVTLQVDMAGATESEVYVSVIDHGQGIAPRDRERLIRPFERAAMDRAVPGSGLGLAIIARTAQRHGGRLQIGNAEQGGAQFTLILPVLRACSTSIYPKSPA
jgi:two-component system osmolarity sensor histidine kinase EnvZ